MRWHYSLNYPAEMESTHPLVLLVLILMDMRRARKKKDRQASGYLLVRDCLKKRIIDIVMVLKMGVLFGKRIMES